MGLAYRPPGVSVSEVVTPTISPLLAAPALICLVGRAQGYQTRTDQFLLTGTSATPLPGLPAGAKLDSVLSVKDALDPSKGAADGSGYTLTSDYTVSIANGTVTRVSNGAITSETLINVTYRYVIDNYFEPTRLYDFGSVESRYGSALDPTGTAINSPLSYAASIAFENGASSIVCQPLLTRATPGDPSSAAGSPNDSQAAALASWADTLFVLRDIEDINVIVPVIGQSMPNVGDATVLSVLQAVQDHCSYMAVSQQYIFGIFGEDNSADTAVATQAILTAHANTLRGRYGGNLSEQLVLLNSASFERALPAFGRTINVGGQYAAAAFAGMLSSFPVSVASTRKVLSGFTRVLDKRDAQQKNADADNGLLVVEQKGGNVLIRHGVTLNNTGGAAKAEINVVRAKHRMIESVRDTIDRQIIGQIIADGNAPNIVSATVSAVLEGLRQVRDIVDYGPVEARYVSMQPTTIQVRFAYRPAFPLNYVNIEFSLDLSNQSIAASSLG